MSKIDTKLIKKQTTTTNAPLAEDKYTSLDSRSEEKQNYHGEMGSSAFWEIPGDVPGGRQRISTFLVKQNALKKQELMNALASRQTDLLKPQGQPPVPQVPDNNIDTASEQTVSVNKFAEPSPTDTQQLTYIKEDSQAEAHPQMDLYQQTVVEEVSEPASNQPELNESADSSDSFSAQETIAEEAVKPVAIPTEINETANHALPDSNPRLNTASEQETIIKELAEPAIARSEFNESADLTEADSQQETVVEKVSKPDVIHSEVNKPVERRDLDLPQQTVLEETPKPAARPQLNTDIPVYAEEKRKKTNWKPLLIALPLLLLAGTGYDYLFNDNEPAVVPVAAIETAKVETITTPVTQNIESDPVQGAAENTPQKLEMLAITPPYITHVVQKGDTLWDISQKYLNDPFLYPEVANLSNIKNPDLIYPGDIVRIDTSLQRIDDKSVSLAKTGNSLNPAAPVRYITHVVKKGDTLWDISRKYLNNPFAYPEVADFSKIRNPHLIYPGDIVRIRIRG